MFGAGQEQESPGAALGWRLAPLRCWHGALHPPRVSIPILGTWGGSAQCQGLGAARAPCQQLCHPSQARAAAEGVRPSPPRAHPARTYPRGDVDGQEEPGQHQDTEHPLPREGKGGQSGAPGWARCPRSWGLPAPRRDRVLPRCPAGQGGQGGLRLPVPTHVPLVGCGRNARGRSRACQADEVPAAHVAGKQGCAHLGKGRNQLWPWRGERREAVPTAWQPLPPPSFPYRFSGLGTSLQLLSAFTANFGCVWDHPASKASNVWVSRGGEGSRKKCQVLASAPAEGPAQASPDETAQPGQAQHKAVSVLGAQGGLETSRSSQVL